MLKLAGECSLLNCYPLIINIKIQHYYSGLYLTIYLLTEIKKGIYHNVV